MATGRVVFALGVTGLGLQHILLGDFPADLEPVPDWVAHRALWANLTGLLLIAAGVGIATNKRPRLAAFVLAVFWLISVALLLVPGLIVTPANATTWVSAFELMTLAGTSLVVAAAAPIEPLFENRWNARIDRMTGAGLVCFCVSSIVFGIVHFLYARFLATLIPAWIPGALTWAYLVGAARIVAGVSILVRVKARLAATLLSVMYGTWVLIVHVPHVAADKSDAREWTLMSLAVAFCGGSWLIAAAVEHRRTTTSATS